MAFQSVTPPNPPGPMHRFDCGFQLITPNGAKLPGPKQKPLRLINHGAVPKQHFLIGQQNKHTL